MSYCKKHLVIFEEPNGTRNRHIVITFDTDPCVNKHLSVRLSDEDDLYFLYLTTISEEDFLALKSQQGLLVDFAGFRQRVVDLLKQCSTEEDSVVPKYMLKFTRSTNCDTIGVLQIIEATNFKYLTHLSLNLSAGNDETVKAYLVSQLKGLKNESKQKIDRLEGCVSELSAKLSETEKKYDVTRKELDSLKTEYRNQESFLKKEFEEKICALKEEHNKVEADLRLSLDQQQHLSSEACETIRNQCASKLEDYKRTNQELVETRDRLQTSVRDLTGQITMLENENSTAKERLTSLRSQLTSVEQICQNQTATITRLESRIATLEQDVTMKDQTLANNQALLTSEREQRNKLRDELQSQIVLTDKLQSSLDKEAEEVKKANEIIRHLQAEVKSHHTKAKLRGQVAAEQERLLSARESELHDRSTELDRLRTELRKASDCVASLTEQLNQANLDLGEAQKTIKTNENIIGWLNRQISESQIGQMQQRLRSGGLAAPVSNPVVTLPSYSPSNLRYGATLVPPWHPTTSLNNPSSTIISRATSGAPNTQMASNPIVPKSIPTTSHDLANDKKFSSTTQPDSVSKTTSILAPITKSTPLNADQSRQPPVACTRFDLGLPNNSNKLPSYIPSTIVAKLHAPNPTNAQTGKSPEADRTLQQQSLTSAYFPKPLGTGAQT